MKKNTGNVSKDSMISDLPNLIIVNGKIERALKINKIKWILN